MMVRTKTKELDLNERTHIMGILNVTPDSFSDGGNYTTVEKALEQAKRMVEEGADIIDIGGESTRPGHTPVSIDEEISRIVPVIEAMKEHLDIPIAVDTFKAETARAALDAGADILNDIWGAKKDSEMAKVAATYGVPIILMHNRMNQDYDNLLSDMIKDLKESIKIAKEAGVSDEQIIIDPGVGFAKSRKDDLLVMNELEKFQELPYPLLLATSRKRVIADVLDVPPVERDIGTAATTSLGIVKGAKIVRVHNVKVNKEIAMMTDAILGKGAHHG